MPAFCNLNVSWNALAPENTMMEVRCRVYAGGNWTSWMSFGKWGPRLSPPERPHPERRRAGVPAGGHCHSGRPRGAARGIQLQVNLSTNDNKITPAVRLLAAAVRPLAWDRQDGAVVNHRLYLPEYSLSEHDPQLWPGDGPVPGDGLPDEPLGGGTSSPKRWPTPCWTLPPPASTMPPYAVAAAACCGLSQLAGLAGPERAAGPDPRRLFGGGGDGDPAGGPEGAGAGLDGPPGLWPR